MTTPKSPARITISAERRDGLEVPAAPDTRKDWNWLRRNATRAELRAIGLKHLANTKSGEVWCFPVEWYPHIPPLMKVVDIGGKWHRFDGTLSSRGAMGVLSYGLLKWGRSKEQEQGQEEQEQRPRPFARFGPQFQERFQGDAVHIAEEIKAEVERLCDAVGPGFPPPDALVLGDIEMPLLLGLPENPDALVWGVDLP